MKKLSPYQIKRLIFGAIFVLLLLPALQYQLRVIKEEPLKGFIVAKPDVHFQKKDWFSGEYQVNFEAWYNENFGFRNSFLRLNNQLLCSLYDTSHAFDMIVGKNGYLFYRNYITAYNGNDYTGEELVDDETYKLKALQDTLEKRGITLVVVLAPGPASYFPEYLPAKFAGEGEKTIYKSLVQKMKAQSVNLLDFNAWFRQMKPAAKYPLITHSGTHWSRYGVMLATDSLVRYIGQKRNAVMPRLFIKKTRVTCDLIPPDNDIYEVANLWSPYIREKVAYPECEYVKPPGKTPLRMAAVGDSYFNVMLSCSGLYPGCFEQVDFWSYNELIYHADGTAATPAEAISTGDEIRKNQVVVFMATEANYGGKFWGFLDEAYDYFCLKKTALPDPAFKKSRTMVMKDKGWFLSIQRQAQAEKISMDSCLRRSAQALAAGAK